MGWLRFILFWALCVGPSLKSEIQPSVDPICPGTLGILASHAVELNSLVSGKPLAEHTLAELDSALSEFVALRRAGNFLRLTNGDFRSQPFAARGSMETVTGTTLLAYYAAKVFALQNPGKAVPVGTKIFSEPGFSQSEITAYFHRAHGAVATLPKRTLRLKSLVAGKDLATYSLAELDAILFEYVTVPLEGNFEKLNTGKKFSTQIFAAVDSTESVSARTILANFGCKLFAARNPSRAALNPQQIFTEPGYSRAELIAHFKAGHGIVSQVPENAILLKSLQPGKDIWTYTLPELDKVISEYVKDYSGDNFSNPTSMSGFRTQLFVAEQSTETVSGATLLIAYGQNLFANQHPGKRIPNRTSFFKTPGFSEREVILRFKKAHGVGVGVANALPKNTIQLLSLKRGKRLANYTLSELEAVLDEYVLTQLEGNYSNFSTSKTFTLQPFAGRAMTKSVIGQTILTFYAQRLYAADQPGIVAPKGKKIFEEAGYSRANVLSRFRESRPRLPAVPLPPPP